MIDNKANNEFASDEVAWRRDEVIRRMANTPPQQHTKAKDVLLEPLRDLPHDQERFDRWRTVYNHERPREALGTAVPASGYQAKSRSFPEVLPAIEYDPGVEGRKVQL